MYELKSPRKSTRNKKIVARIKQQLIERQEFFCVYFRVILCYHRHNRKVKLDEKKILIIRYFFLIKFFNYVIIKKDYSKFLLKMVN